LIGKAKNEGEEALRKCVVALNGLAALAIIEKDLSHAVSLYREASTLSEENLENFRLDPLLNLHILHNLAEINDAVLSPDTNGNSKGEKTVNGSQKGDGKLFEGFMKKQRMLESGDSSSTKTLEKSIAIPDSCSTVDPVAMDSCFNSDLQQQGDLRTVRYNFLMKQCECIKEKYMLQFISKLAAARDEFRSSYSQVFKSTELCSLCYNSV
jgi:E3 ubiquitin-protein ligase SHPRH